MFYFENEIDNLDIPKVGKIALEALSKLIAVTTDKRLSILEILKNPWKATVKLTLEAWQEGNWWAKETIIKERYNFLTESKKKRLKDQKKFAAVQKRPSQALWESFQGDGCQDKNN